MTADDVKAMMAMLGVQGDETTLTSPETLASVLCMAVKRISDLTSQIAALSQEKDQKGRDEKTHRGLMDLVSAKGIIPQDKFGGNMAVAKFRSWAYQIKATIKAKDGVLARMMTEAEAADLQTMRLEDTPGGRRLLDEDPEKDQLLHAVLVNIVEMGSEPFKILENNDAQGLECWRLFHRRWNRTTAMNSIQVAENMRKLERAKSGEEVYSRIQDHRKLVLDWEKLRGAAYPAIDLKADYMRIVPETWSVKMRLDTELDYENEATTPEEVLRKIEDYVRVFTSGGAPMDVSNVVPNNAPEKNSEKEEAPEHDHSHGVPADALGQPNPNIECWTCGQKGHPQSKCPKRAGKGADKGKGKGKGYGKAKGYGWNQYYGYWGGQAYPQKGKGSGYGKGGAPTYQPKGKGKGWGYGGKGGQGPAPMDLGSFAGPYMSDFGGDDWSGGGGGDWSEGTPVWSLEKKYRTPQEIEAKTSTKIDKESGWNEVVRLKAAGMSQKDKKTLRRQEIEASRSKNRYSALDEGDEDSESEDEVHCQLTAVNGSKSGMPTNKQQRGSPSKSRKKTNVAYFMPQPAKRTAQESVKQGKPAMRSDKSRQTVEPAKDVMPLEVHYRGNCVDNMEAKENDWFLVPGGITVDSGAGENVMPNNGMCANYPTLEGDQKKMGVYYIAANGDELDNEGEKRLQLTDFQGAQSRMVFQVTGVNKMLGSVSKMCATGQQVVFNPPGHPDGSYVRDLHTETRTPLREENGTYKMDAWVNPNLPSQAGFGRQA